MNPKEMEESINYELREKHKSSYCTWRHFRICTFIGWTYGGILWHDGTV